jgi:hypothetical protein
MPNLRIYDMALLTYLIAFGHFTSEICFFRTAKINLPVLSPVIVSSMCSFVNDFPLQILTGAPQLHH